MISLSNCSKSYMTTMSSNDFLPSADELIFTSSPPRPSAPDSGPVRGSASNNNASTTIRPSQGRRRHQRSSDPVPVTVTVQPSHIVAATKEMYDSPASQYLVDGASFLQRIVVAELVLAQRRAGVPDVDVDDVVLAILELTALSTGRSATALTCNNKGKRSKKTARNGGGRDDERSAQALLWAADLPLPAATGEFLVAQALAELASLGIVLYDPRGRVAQLSLSEQDALFALKQDKALTKLVRL
ncbi:hypothetical protein BC828DRAFT_180013 [Blastocladiella britannica]|nr:hypothetical protein BC828DRAFT_180013 [Blastocladiella britannica]